MAFTINYNGTNYSLWSCPNKITTPSLIIDGSNYVPLASGNINDWVDIQGNGFQYQLSPLLVDGSKRAPYARRFVKNISGTLSGNITGTATTTGNVSHTVTGVAHAGGTVRVFGAPGASNTEVIGSGVWNFGTTFNSPPNVTYTHTDSSNVSISNVTNTSAAWSASGTVMVDYTEAGNGAYGGAIEKIKSYNDTIYLTATGTISTTVGTSESKSITVSKTDSYGVTYPSTPSIINLSGASIQSQGTSSATVAAVLTGTVNNGQTLTLTRAYSYTVLGAI